MTIRARSLWFAFLTTAWLLTGSPARAAHGFVDEAGLFGKVYFNEKIGAEIDDIYRRYHVDLRIETVQTTPTDRDADWKHLGRAKFFAIWAEERALAASVDGVYILICSSPRHVEVYVSDSVKDTFDKRTREKLRKTLVHELGIAGHEYQGVSETLAIVQDRLQSQEADAKRTGWAWVVWLILGIVGVWLVIALIRRFQVGKSVEPPSAVSSGALAGQSIYQAIAGQQAPEGGQTEATPAAQPDVPTLPYPAPSPARAEGTVHG